MGWLQLASFVKRMEVAVYEAASVPGGAVKSGEYIEPGFLHDWAAMNLSLFAGSNFTKSMVRNWLNVGWNLPLRLIALLVFFRMELGLVSRTMPP